MELRDFIAGTLVEIQTGVHAAILVTKGKVGGAINPSWASEGAVDSGLVEKVQFDIAVTVSEEKKGSGEAGIEVVGIKLGGGGGIANERTHVSRIQFSIPVVLPVTRLVSEQK